MTAARSEVPVAVTVLRHGDGIPLPRYASAGAAGMDLVAALEALASVQPAVPDPWPDEARTLFVDLLLAGQRAGGFSVKAARTRPGR